MLTLDYKKVKGITWEIPETWEEITTDQFIKIQGLDPKDEYYDSKWFAILLNVSEDIVLNLTDPKVILDVQTAKINLQKTFPDLDKLKKEKYLIIDKKKIRVPQDLGKETFGQKMAMERLIETYKDNLHEAIPEAIAIYLQPQIAYETKGRYNYMYIPKVVRMIKEMPIYLTYPIANFFFHKLRNYKALGSLDLLNYRVTLMKRLLKQLLNPKDLKPLEKWVQSEDS